MNKRIKKKHEWLGTKRAGAKAYVSLSQAFVPIKENENGKL